MIEIRARALVALLILAVGLGACGGPPQNVGAAPAGAGGATPQLLPTTAYRLASGDRVRVVVFRHEDLSGEFALDAGGNLAMPLVGEIEANGLTTRELEQRLVERLGGGYLVEPQVSVEVLNYRPFYILGEVKSPGSYPFVNGMTVLNAVALAGGFSYRANQGRIMVRRGGSNVPAVTVPGDQTILPGDVIEVPERFF